MAHSAFAAEPIDIGRALDVIQSFETRIQVVEYHVEVMSAQLSDADDLESVVKRLPGESHAFVRFDPIGRRYYAEFDAVLRASSGQQPKNDEPQFWASKSVYANDGEVFRTWYRGKDGTEIPREGDESAFGEGTIAPATDEVEHVQHEGFLQVYGAQAGIVWMPPFFYTTYEPPRPLSALLRSKIDKGIPVSVVAQHDNIWIITTQTSPGPFDATLEMQYDVSKGCVVRATWANGDPQVIYKRLETKLRRVDGFWAPAEVNLVATLGAARLDRCTFRDVAFNKPVTDADFRLTFPKGVRLNDYIEKKHYITGSGIVDDQKAIREFMVRHALKPPNREQPPTGAAGTFRWLLVINGVGLLALVAFLVYRRRKAASVLIAASLGLCPSVLSADELLPDGNWVVSYSPGERIYKSQCGFLATVFALEYFDIHYSVRHVSNGLRPTKAGILFADIQRMLEAHGLQAVARQQVTADDLAGALKPNTLAILAISRPKGGSHYFVAAQSQNGRPLLVDVLKKAYPLPETLKDPAVKADYDGLVLFVRTKPQRNNQIDITSIATQVEISPERINLGEFVISGPKASNRLPATFRIKNLTSEPIMVSAVQPSCGCTTTGWDGGIVAAGAIQNVNVDVFPQGWGAGLQRKLVRIEFHDGSHRDVELMGKGLTVESVQSLTVAPKTIYVDVTRLLPADSQRTSITHATVTAEPEQLERLQLQTNVPWLSPKLVSVDDATARLQLELTVTDELLDRFASSNGSVVGRVSIATKKDEPPVRVHVVLVRRPFYKLSESTIVLSPNEAGHAVISPTSSTGESNAVTVSKIWSIPSGLVLESQEQEDGAVVIGVRAADSVKPGIYVVKCNLVSSVGERATGSFVVRLKDRSDAKPARTVSASDSTDDDQ